ncbi:hypothetical protein ACLOJK_035183 [Asimina triloba]
MKLLRWHLLPLDRKEAPESTSMRVEIPLRNLLRLSNKRKCPTRLGLLLSRFKTISEQRM